MPIDINMLPSDVETLQKMVVELFNRLEALEAKHQDTLEELRLLKQKHYGVSSEVALPPARHEEEHNEEQGDSPALDEDNPITVTVTRKKSRPRQPLPKDLPRERVVVDVSPDEKWCDCCQCERGRIGEEVSEKLLYVPASWKVQDIVRPKYACRQCEKEKTHVQIVIAPMPAMLIPKSFATPSLLAQIVSAKFCYALPLYRQEKQFAELGVTLNRQTMSRWMMTCADEVQPLLDLLKAYLLKQDILFADETTLKVVDSQKKKSYIWVYGHGSDTAAKGDISIVLFDYQEGSRSHLCPVRYLEGYDGYLQVDGYKAYKRTDATLVGCWAHARRKFTDVIKALPKAAKQKPGKAQWAVSIIKKLYAIEKHLANEKASVEEVYRTRQEEAKPIVEEFERWLDKSLKQVPPSSLLGKAIAYCLGQWTKLTVYLLDGRLSIDNNRAERAVRPFTIGRKNWVLSNTHHGVQSSAALYSLVETAKANGKSPYAYLEYLFTELPKVTDGNYDHLLPWNFQEAGNSS
ncbi:IS66 family transposase [Vibrio mediterranei]